jgi:hypothetical protein
MLVIVAFFVVLVSAIAGFAVPLLWIVSAGLMFLLLCTAVVGRGPVAGSHRFYRRERVGSA